ncbi:hypothetical protein [Rhizobium mongolense]|uniref:hypothetical protein n=1 Tax=Rhizobium mongolense TaxID=57676 RepID=UPI001113BAAF|nr:hypothetical protein [Rhizobium mongolense]
MRQGSFARILFGGFISEELVASGIQLERIDWIDFHNVLASRDEFDDEDDRTKKCGGLKRMRFRQVHLGRKNGNSAAHGVRENPETEAFR